VATRSLARSQLNRAEIAKIGLVREEVLSIFDSIESMATPAN
jgi:hypothetical protein